jgi:hypothetical protein
MLVLLDQGGCPVPVTAYPWARLLARLHAHRLDAEIARGASPDGSLPLALRAQALLRDSARRDLAVGAERVLASVGCKPCVAGHRIRLPVPVRAEQVRACSVELADLADRLAADGPVNAQGVARARTLLADAASPLYHGAACEDLRAAIRSAADALAAG